MSDEKPDFAGRDPLVLSLMGMLTAGPHSHEEIFGEGHPSDLEAIGLGQAVNVRQKFPDDCFALRIDGYPFEGFGIKDGDFLAVMPTDVAEEGRLMIVRSAKGYTLLGCQDGKLWEWDYAYTITDGPDSYPVELEDGETIIGFVFQVLGDRRFSLRMRKSRYPD